MYYLRFLKPPRIVVDILDGPVVRLVVTIVTDLGDDVFHGDIDLAVTVVSDPQQSPDLGRQVHRWRRGARALPVDIKLDVPYKRAPLRVHVNCQDSAYEVAGMHKGTITMPRIFPVASALIKGENMEAQRVALRTFPLGYDRAISIYEDTGESISRHVWDAGVALIYYINHSLTNAPTALYSLDQCLAKASKSTLNVIELGTGCGLVGIALATVVPNCKVLLTDMEDAASLNIPESSSNLSYYHLDWGHDIPRRVLSSSFDLIIAADCTYNPDSAPDLVKTISSLHSKSKNALIIIASKTRHSSESVFFELMHRKFSQHGNVSVLSPSPYKEGCLEDMEEIELYAFKNS